MERKPSTQRALALAGRACRMRRLPTSSEAVLWERLRGSRLGIGFRRQFVIGEWSVDFAAPSVALVVEVDGGYHAARERADGRRDRQLGALGWRVVRVPAELVMGNVEAAVALVRAAL